VALLFLGLICASWLSIGSEKKETDSTLPHQVLASDTSKKDGLRSLKKNDNRRRSDEPADIALPAIPAEPRERPEIFEFPPVPDVEFNFDEMAEVPHEFEMPMIPEMFEAPVMPGFGYNIFDGGDSIPGYHFQFRDIEDWDAFEKEFKEKFKSQFKDFYNKNHEQFDKMMEEMKKNRGEARMSREAAEVVNLDNMLRNKISMDAMRHADVEVLMGTLNAMSASDQAEQAMRAQEFAKIAADRNLLMLNDQLRESSERLVDMSRRYEDFNKALIEQLAADGYIKPGEDIDQLQINDSNGTMTINGKSIKEKDRIKYKALQDKYLKTDRMPLIPGRSE
jgi:hypothetical protein